MTKVIGIKDWSEWWWLDKCDNDIYDNEYIYNSRDYKVCKQPMIMINNCKIVMIDIINRWWLVVDGNSDEWLWIKW